MEKKQTYIIQNRKQPDYCNICGKMAFLTWDHIPPKSLLQEPNTYANTLFHELPSPDRHMRQYQNGIKYQSICSHCNNDLVGQYDADLSAFSKGIIIELNRCEQRILNHEINHVNSITVTTKINRVLRAICGHFLAMKNHYDDENIVDCYLRTYLTDTNQTFSALFLHCWLYPYSTILNARDFVVVNTHQSTHPKGMVSVMSCYPLAFLISTVDETAASLDNLGSYSTTKIDEEIPVTLRLSTAYYTNTHKIKDLSWPCNVSSDEFETPDLLGYQQLINDSRLGVPHKK